MSSGRKTEQKTLLQFKKLQEVCGGLLYRADRVADRVAESSRMQENL